MTYLRMNHFLKLRTQPPAATPHVEAPAPAPAAVPRVVPVSKVKRRHVALAACAILAAGCGRNEAVSSVVFAEQAAADKAKAVLAPPQQAATPEKQMTKAEESKAMPMPGQANNHSSPVPAKTGGK